MCHTRKGLSAFTAVLFAFAASIPASAQPDPTQSYFVPQAGPLDTPCEGGTGGCGAVPGYSLTVSGGAIGCARTCPDNDGGQVLRNWARLKIVVIAADGTPIPDIAAADICASFNGGTLAQGFPGAGADSIAADPMWSGGVAGGCPVVRCIEADAPTDANGVTYITWRGHAAADPPGVSSVRDPLRKWGGRDSDIPIFVLGVKLQGKLTSLSALGSYTALVKNFDNAGSTLAAGAFAEKVTNPIDVDPVLAGFITYNFWVDFDNSGGMGLQDWNALTGHMNHTCIVPLP